MTLTLTPEIEQAIDEAAKRQGTTPEQVAAAALEAGLLSPALNPQPIRNPPTAEAERQARVRAGKGSLAHLGPSRLSQDKAAEKAREERRWRQTPEETA